jgi:hypothetical protein
MSCCDELFEIIFRLTLKMTTPTICVVLGEIIAAHQHGIMRRSRQLQNLFRLPTCTHIFSEADTQVHHDDIKVSAIALTYMTMFVSVGALDVLIESPTSALARPWIECGMVALMVIPVLLLWPRLALRCRRRHRNRRAVAWNIEDVSTDDPNTTCGVGRNEDTALLTAEKGPQGGKEHKAEDYQLRKYGPSKKEVDTADKRRHGDGRSNPYGYGPRVSWTDPELPFAWLLG